MPRVLLIDDRWGRSDDPILELTYGMLPFEWLKETASVGDDAYSIHAAITRVRAEAPRLDLVMLDMAFGSSGAPLGIDILEQIRMEFPTMPVLIFTSLDSGEHRELVVRCMEAGANEYIEKAPAPRRLSAMLQAYTEPDADSAIYGNSKSIRDLRARIARVAMGAGTSILVCGESGSGKELVAVALHRQGQYRDGAFVAKNCAHSDSQLLESELFGHEKGAFTGASVSRTGLIEEANGGVLFLDEIGDMPLELQAKLLRVLDTRSFRRLGSSRNLTSDFQLVCALNRDPHVLVQQGILRNDFFFRASAFLLNVPPLRDRRGDIPILAELFLRRLQLRAGVRGPARHLTQGAIDRLRCHPWRGNVRELRNVVEHALVMSDAAALDAEAIGDALGPSVASANVEEPNRASAVLPQDPHHWPRERLLAELRIAVAAKRRVQHHRRGHWKAEFMRSLYPECRAASAKGFNDLIRRLTRGPWGMSDWGDDSEIARLLDDLQD